jgi:glycosyltransferase involved in cell wall biosynthesis
MKQKIAIMGIRGVPATFPGSGGIDTYVENQLVKLQKKYIVTLFSRSWAKNKPKYYTVPVFCLNNMYLDTGIYTVLVTFYALFTGADIFWYHAPGSALFSFLPRLLGKKVILTLHGIDWRREKWANPVTKNFIHLLEILAVHSATEIQIVSSTLEEYVNHTYHRPTIFAPPHTIVTKTIQNNLLDQWHLISNNYLLYLGRLVPEKRVDWLINAFQNLLPHNSFKLVISGLLDQSKYCRQLKTYANSRIIFTDYVSGNTKSQLLNHCRAFILPSIMEGNPLALNEALSIGKTCLASDIPPHLELAKKYPHLILFKTDHISDLTLKLSQLYPQTSKVFNHT